MILLKEILPGEHAQVEFGDGAIDLTTLQNTEAEEETAQEEEAEPARR